MTAPLTTAKDLALVRDLETCAIPAGGFGHADHVRAAWTMLQRQSLDEVIPRFRRALQTFAAHHDAPDLYHETVTRAYLLAIDERIRRSPRPLRWPEFHRRYPELFEDYRVFLERHYSPAVLDSDLAKHTFVPPDRLPIVRSEEPQPVA